jgi:hypothetical protein
MPNVQVVADDGRVTLLERLNATNLDEEHFRRCLAERIAWAAHDAEDGEREASPAPAGTG